VRFAAILLHLRSFLQGKGAARNFSGGCSPGAPNARVTTAIAQVNSMAISQDLLEMLVCPACKVPVRLLDDHRGLKCPQCRRVYPVRDDIPVMLLEEATIAAE
jgi:uncharacterized protein YbaR (Trm112 family)